MLATAPTAPTTAGATATIDAGPDGVLTATATTTTVETTDIVPAKDDAGTAQTEASMPAAVGPVYNETLPAVDAGTVATAEEEGKGAVTAVAASEPVVEEVRPEGQGGDPAGAV
jgi:hypothetical protein